MAGFACEEAVLEVLGGNPALLRLRFWRAPAAVVQDRDQAHVAYALSTE